MKKRPFVLLALLVSLSLSGCDFNSFLNGLFPTKEIVDNENNDDDGDDEEKAVLQSISVSSYYREFNKGDKFVGETVFAHYSDGSSKVVNASFSGYDMSQPGNQTVLVSYTGGGITKTTSYTITVIKGTGGGTDITDNDDETVKAYYSSISSSLSGTSLRTALNSLNKSKIGQKPGYDGLKSLYKNIDADPSGSGKILGFYDNKLIGPTWDSAKTWNREHVWPKSKGGNKVEADAYMPRPTAVQSNSDRGNDFYAASGAFDPGYAIKNYRGIAARIIFYCAIADTSLNIIDSASGGDNTMGKLSDLLKWNLEYLPSYDENAAPELRCEYLKQTKIPQYSSQKNRNPFVDHPEYACKIWGNTNSATKSICGGY